MGNGAAAEDGLDRQRARPRQALARAGNDDVRIDRLCGFDDGLRCGGDPAGGLEQGLADLPAGMERRSRAFGREQQSAGLQARSRWRELDDARAGQGHDPAGFLAAGRDHRLASFEPDAAVAVAESERVGGQVAVRDILGEPAAQVVVGNCEHLDRSGFWNGRSAFITSTRARCSDRRFAVYDEIHRGGRAIWVFLQ